MRVFRFFYLFVLRASESLWSRLSGFRSWAGFIERNKRGVFNRISNGILFSLSFGAGIVLEQAGPRHLLLYLVDSQRYEIGEDLDPAFCDDDEVFTTNIDLFFADLERRLDGKHHPRPEWTAVLPHIVRRHADPQ